MEMTDIKIQTKQHEKEKLSSNEKNAKETSKESTFLKVFEKFTGDGAQSLMNGIFGVNFMPEVSDSAPVEAPKSEENTDSQVEEPVVKENQPEKNAAEQTDEKPEEVNEQDKEEVVETKQQKTVEVVKQEAQTTEQVAAQVVTQNTNEKSVELDTVAKNQSSEGAHKFQLLDQNGQQNNLRSNQNAEKQIVETASKTAQVEEQAIKQPSEMSKTSQLDVASKVNELKDKTTGAASDTVTEAIAGKAEVAVDAKSLTADKSKPMSQADTAALRNMQTAMLITGAENASHSSTTNSGEAASRQSNNIISGINNLQGKMGLKKITADAAGDLPKAQQDKIIDKLKQMVETASSSKIANTMIVRLDPPELGQVIMKITHRGDQVFARIIPESKEVESVIRSGSSDLISILVGAGFKAENIHLSFGGDAQPRNNAFGQMLNQQNSGSGTNWNSKEQAQKENLTANFSSNTQNSNSEQIGWVA